MTRPKLLSLLLFILVTSCNTQAQQPNNKKPMYGEVEKTEEYKKLDEDFISTTTALNGGSREKGSHSLNKKAWSFLYHDSLDVAMKRFNQAWLLDPENPEPYFGFGAILDLRNDKAEAERLYKIGISKDKTKTESLYQKVADCQEQLQNIEGAVDTYEKIIDVNPKNTFAYKKLGYFYMQSKVSEKAISYYNKAIDLDPEDAMTYNNRAYLYQTLKNYPLAIEDYTSAIRLDDKYISAYVNRGMTKMETGDYEGAKKDFEMCVGLDAKTGELRRFLGIAKMNLKDKKGACNDFEKAVSLGDIQTVELIDQNCK